MMKPHQMNASIACLIVVSFSACASMPENLSQTASKTADAVTTLDAPESVDALGDTSTFGDAALTPLEDINIRKAEIPQALLNMDSPYRKPSDGSCLALLKEIENYDRLLGPDFDDSERVEKSNEVMALNAASSLIGGLIPFRGLVRTASGAASYDKEIERAYRKGVARRGFLKGLSVSERC